ncbi:hypothetical protein SAMN05216319_1058 [Duganella sp. CF402]|uniref:glycine-rich domain-containing protein n=1 Tax=unclassified Duganella TaxID=2636909 RepID=UPI0008B89234|nr:MULTISPECIES: hypothetical protein [unclassified Duganella]RZT10484.1 hypothetical protein EV582_2568 [Duganella sp. BK701]SEL11159.1 hypothetical protein SAMN05216319_1058 [Duganella sp. CF402]
MNTATSIACIALAGVSAVLWARQHQARREAYIRDFILPHGLFDKLRARHPHLSLKDCQLVAQGLRQFFLAHLKSGRKYVSMPSQVADDLWHEFILYTRNYEQFCRKAFVEAEEATAVEMVAAAAAAVVAAATNPIINVIRLRAPLTRCAQMQILDLHSFPAG